MEFYIKKHLVLIDDQDVEFVAFKKWNVSKKGTEHYVVFNQTNKDRSVTRFWLHRVIMGVQGLEWKNTIVDHINGNPLDNRRCNLRLVSACQNSMNKRIQKNNKSGFKGVDWHKKNKSFRARISVNKKRIELGAFKTAEEAARAYDEAAKKYHGEYAKLNFPD